ncbi:MAG: acetyl-coenzyme A synthetase N-terminal domain-containing protein, partial [Pseudomonadota bacterium]
MIHSVERPQQIRAAHCVAEQYTEMHRRSVEEPDIFWLGESCRLDWFCSPTLGGDWSFSPARIRWFADGTLNLCYNAVDR